MRKGIWKPIGLRRELFQRVHHFYYLGESGTGLNLSSFEFLAKPSDYSSKKIGRIIQRCRSVKDYKIDELREIEKLAQFKSSSKNYVVFEEFQYSNVSKTPSFLPTF